MSSSTFNITPSLVDDPRHNLEAWTENVETHARNMCASHDLMGALTLVVSDVTWDLVPANLSSPCRKRRFGISQLTSHVDGEVQ